MLLPEKIWRLRTTARGEALASHTDQHGPRPESDDHDDLLNKLFSSSLCTLFDQDYKRTCYAGLHPLSCQALGLTPSMSVDHDELARPMPNRARRAGRL
jgi:hypothetical protein